MHRHVYRQFADDQKNCIAELDVNPLICAGERIIAVDALIVRARQTPHTPEKEAHDHHAEETHG